VGMLRAQKGQEAFLLVSRLIKENDPQVKFVIVGDLYYEYGKIDPHLLVICASLNLNGEALFTGFRNDIENIFASFDIFVHSSLSQESHGRTILEAMAAGKPVVAFDDGGPRELVVDGSTGFLVPVGDIKLMAERIVALLKDTELRVRMGHEAKRVFKEKFSMAKYGKDMEGIYYKALEHARSPHETTGAMK
jgi:glycosyltransferase involved in cell wall biosynthesis